MCYERAPTHWVTQREMRTNALKKQVGCGFGPQVDGVWPSVKRAIDLETYLAFWN
jgi:hypothetical protein